jgi:hypothetical protein
LASIPPILGRAAPDSFGRKPLTTPETTVADVLVIGMRSRTATLPIEALLVDACLSQGTATGLADD